MADFLAAARERVVIIDGAIGTSLQALDLTLDDFDGLEGCNEVLVRTRPDVIRAVHDAFIDVGCDAVETDTFGGAPWVLDEYDLGAATEELNAAAARLARQACDAAAAQRPDGLWVIGSIGPGTRSPTLSLGKDPAVAKDFIDYDVMVAGYLRQVRGLLSGGSDVLLVETVFDLLQAKAAIWACHEAMAAEGLTVPIMVSVTIEADINTMLLGSEIGAALTALDPLGVDVIGLNCATGPGDMREQVRYLSQHSRLPISVVPNAGIPAMVDGAASYPLSPAALAEAHREFITDFGVAIVGGCCGTTPEHLAAVVEACADLPPVPRTPELEPSLASLYSPVPLDQDNSFLIIGERLNANGSRKFKDLLLAEDWEAVTQMAREQVREGAHTLDVCVDYVGRDGTADMVEVVDRLATQSTLPLVIDSTELKVVSAALRRIGGRAVINSVNLEDGRRKADVLFGLARQFGAALVALAIDEEGQARTVDWKVDVCKRIAAIAIDEYGLSAEDLIFDTLTFPLGSGQEDLRGDAMATIEAIRRVKAEIPGCHTVLGVSNISFGLSPAARQVLNSVFLAEAMKAGLDAAIVHPAKILPLHKIDDEALRVCTDLIYDRRSAAVSGDQGRGTSEQDYDPLHRLMELFEGATETRASAEELAALPLTERLERRIIDGDRDGLSDDLDAAMRDGLAPLEIINTHLLAGMKVVGELFGSGQMQLPFVLQSAECMKAAVAHLEPHMEASDSGGKAKIVLATVKGDVHDIGKNLVDIILTNNGYDVRNIGIKQPIDAIIAAAEDFKADAIGLSGLLVKSTVVMREDLEELNRRGLSAQYPVLLGGAALNRAYVEIDLRGTYEGPLFYCRDAFSGLHQMDELVAHRSSGGPPQGWGREVGERRVSGSGGGDKGDVTEVVVPHVATDVPVPTPPFWGSRVTRGIPLDDIAALLNRVALFRNQWGFAKEQMGEEAEAALRTTLALCRAEGILVPQAVHGYWPANAEGNDLIVWDGPDSEVEAARFTFPRQTKGKRLCIADFFRPVSSGERDVIAFHAVTMGRRVSERAADLFAADAYTDYLYLHGLGVEMAEALAELWHARIRRELGIDGADADTPHGLFTQGYQGSRYSFGYAACPDLAARKPLFDLLDASRLGLELSEEFQLHPEQSTDALVVHHPEAKYFNAR